MGQSSIGFSLPPGEWADVDRITQKSIRRRLLKITSPSSLPLARSRGSLSRGHLVLVPTKRVGFRQTRRRQGWACKVTHTPLSSLLSAVHSWGAAAFPSDLAQAEQGPG